MGIPCIKRVDNRFQLVLIVDLHGAVDIKFALNEVLIEHQGDVLPLSRCDPWGYQLNQDFVLSGALDFSFCGQQLAVINE
jgi:hypothetical protein